MWIHTHTPRPRKPRIDAVRAHSNQPASILALCCSYPEFSDTFCSVDSGWKCVRLHRNKNKKKTLLILESFRIKCSFSIQFWGRNKSQINIFSLRKRLALIIYMQLFHSISLSLSRSRPLCDGFDIMSAPESGKNNLNYHSILIRRDNNT